MLRESVKKIIGKVKEIWWIKNIKYPTNKELYEELSPEENLIYLYKKLQKSLKNKEDAYYNYIILKDYIKKANTENIFSPEIIKIKSEMEKLHKQSIMIEIKSMYKKLKIILKNKDDIDDIDGIKNIIHYPAFLSPKSILEEVDKAWITSPEIIEIKNQMEKHPNIFN